MITNTSCTLYNVYEAGGQTLYWRTVLEAVMWQGGRSGSESGKIGVRSESGTVFVPFSAKAGGKAYMPPNAWEAAADKSRAFTFRPGDYLVKGVCLEEYGPTHPIRHLAREHDDVLTISTVETCDFGSADMQHWEIGGV